MRLASSARWLLAGSLALAACDGGVVDEDPGTPDAGVVKVPDAGHDGPNPPTICDEPLLEATLVNDRASLQLDTREVVGAPRDLGIGCNNDEATEWAPQAVVQVTIPGTGPRTLRLSTRNEVTDSKFATILQVRETCEEIPTNLFPNQCLAPGNDDVRAAGDVAVEGGRTYLVFVTGYSEAPSGYLDRGLLQLDLEVRDTARPVLESASGRFVGKDFEARGTVSDSDRDIGGLLATFVDAEGKLVDLDGNGTGDASDYVAFSFSANLTGVARYTGAIRVSAVTDFLKSKGAAKARISAWDRAFGRSEPVEVELGETPGARLDEACSDEAPCVTGLACASGTCAASASVTNACAAATMLNLPVPTGDEATSVSVSGTLRTGDGIFSGTCADTGGREAIVAVEVPAGKFDLLARTDIAGTDERADTVVYIRSTCADPGTEVACNDEVKRGDSRSFARAYAVSPGLHHVFIEPYQTAQAQTRYKVQVSLRPILPTGSACDVTEAKNRCENARCLRATEKCP